MQIKAGGVHIFAAMRKAHGEVRFVGTLVGGKSHIAINAEQRSAGAARVGRQMRRDLVQRACEIRNELQRGLAEMALIFFFVREEPVAVVVALQAGEETEEFGSEIGWHGFSQLFYLRKSVCLPARLRLRWTAQGAVGT